MECLQCCGTKLVKGLNVNLKKMSSLNYEEKICIVTGSRSEYGLLRWLMEDINDSNLSLQLVVTGSHLLMNMEIHKRKLKGRILINKKIDTF